MRLEAFTVRNFRSIRRAARIPVRAGMTVLIGPNNEGKTNLLRAMGLAQATLQIMANSHHAAWFAMQASCEGDGAGNEAP